MNVHKHTIQWSKLPPKCLLRAKLSLGKNDDLAHVACPMPIHCGWLRVSPNSDKCFPGGKSTAGWQLQLSMYNYKYQIVCRIPIPKGLLHIILIKTKNTPKTSDPFFHARNDLTETHWVTCGASHVKPSMGRSPKGNSLLPIDYLLGLRSSMKWN